MGAMAARRQAGLVHNDWAAGVHTPWAGQGALSHNGGEGHGSARQGGGPTCTASAVMESAILPVWPSPTRSMFCAGVWVGLG